MQTLASSRPTGVGMGLYHIDGEAEGMEDYLREHLGGQAIHPQLFNMKGGFTIM